MSVKPAIRAMLMQRAGRNEPSEYAADDGRRMIGYERDPRRERMRADSTERSYPRNDYAGHMPPANGYGYPPEMRTPVYPLSPDMRAGNAYGDIYAHGSIYAPGAMNKPAEYRSYDRDTHEPITEHKARKWVEHMTTGEHYKPEVTEQHRAALCPDCEKWEYFVAMNAMYADFSKTAKEMGIDKPEYYARLARDFIHDDDAGPGKVAKYMEIIPKK